MSLMFCHRFVNWIRSWILSVSLNILLPLSKLTFPISPNSSDLELLRQRLPLNLFGRVHPGPPHYPDSSQTSGTWTLSLQPPLKKGSPRHLEPPTSWRSEVQIDQAGFSSEADSFLCWTAFPQSWIQLFHLQFETFIIIFFALLLLVFSFCKGVRRQGSWILAAMAESTAKAMAVLAFSFLN